jgi:RNA polymerase-binding transcription factor DksA
MTNTDELRTRLQARLKELGAEVERLETESAQPLDADWSEQANQIEDLETSEGLEQVRLEEAREIRAALQRIADGTYGTCASCGAEIAPARLKALPTATLCINCAP